MTYIRSAAKWLFLSLAMIACGLTALSSVRSNQWWIRLLDFPRVLALIAIVVIAIGCLAFARRRHRWVLVALAIAGGFQLWRIYPYIPGAPSEVARIGVETTADARSCFKAFALNVLQSNRDYRLVIAAIEREQPDIVLLVETDQKWLNALAPVLGGYPHRLLRPHDNFYGMIFASRLGVAWAHTENITDRDTPTLFARLKTRGGAAFDFVGLHPRPPIPGENTRRRDAKIERAARRFADDRIPGIAMGDFNDVPWSHTSRTFKRAGGFLDPRIGRGIYSTYPARLGALGWPLDQLFVTSQFGFRSLRVLENVESDHRPLVAELCFTSTRLPPQQDAP